MCATVFDWARFRGTKGVVKLHMVLDHDGHLPSYFVITDGKRSDMDSEGKDFVFLTNRLDLSAATIAEIYRRRWQIVGGKLQILKEYLCSFLGHGSMIPPR